MPHPRAVVWRETSLVALLHLLLALIATYPLARDFNQVVIGSGDTVQNAWNLWWTRWAAHHGNWLPLSTDRLYHPTGVTLAFHPLGLPNGWLGVLLQDGLGLSLAATFNTLALFTFVTTGLTTFWLARWLTGSPWAALTASLIFTYAPIRMSRVQFGNLEMYSTQFIPLAALFTLWTVKGGRVRDGALTGLALAATAWLSLYLGLGTALLIGLLVLFDLLGARDQPRLARLRALAPALLTLVGVSSLLILPLVWPMAQSLTEFRDQADQSAAALANSADLLGFFIPDSLTRPTLVSLVPPLAQAVEGVYARFAGNAYEKTVFIGYTVLVLVALSILAQGRHLDRRWPGLGLVFFVLSLGPALHIAGQASLSPLPYAWLNTLPLIGFGRVPSRLAVFLMLALALMAAQGLAVLARRQPALAWVSLLAGALVFLEFLVAPVRLDRRFTQMPPVYADFVRQSGASAVLDVPIDLVGAQGPAGTYMLYQTAHERPIVSGYISRTPYRVRSLFERPFLNELRARIYGDTAPVRLTPDTLAGARDDLRGLGVGLVILHQTEVTSEDGLALRAGLASVLGAPVYEDERLTLWEVMD